MRRLFALILLMFCANIQSNASHFSGAELRYEFNGTNYTVILDLYTECKNNIQQMLPLAYVNVSSAFLNKSTTLNMFRVKSDIIYDPCVSTSNCQAVSAYNLSFIKVTYQDTTSLPMNLAPDWKFSFSSGARVANISNIQIGTSAGTSVYVEALLNNMNRHNSSAYIPNPIFSFGYSTNEIYKLPMQTIDPDGDSIVYEIITPMMIANKNATYNTSYSFTSPFGHSGHYSIDPVNQTMTVKCVNQGGYVAAFKVKEYHNGQLIASYMRDLTFRFLPAGNDAGTYPEFTTNTARQVYACPSSSGASYVWFKDTDPSDTVFISAVTPNVPGLTFSQTTQKGSPMGSAKVSWVASSTFDPVKTPYFYITYHVWDNHCPRAIARYAVLVKSIQCSADSVWPGDANSDNVVNLFDPLAVALAYNSTGTIRTNASNNWVGQYALNWNSTIPSTSTDKKHADCNGDGVVNMSDLTAISSNYSLTHKKGAAQKKTTGTTGLYFLVNGVHFSPGATATLPIALGNNTSPVTNVYGMATRVKVTETVPSVQAKITHVNSWLGNKTSTIHFEKDIDKNVIDWAYARYDQSNASGGGIIGVLELEVPSTAQPGDTIRFSFENTMLIDKDGKLITDYKVEDTFAIIQFPVSINHVTQQKVIGTVVPNPSHGQASLSIYTLQEEKLDISIVDIYGKKLWVKSLLATKGSSVIQLPSLVNTGVYFIQLSSKKGTSQTLKWVTY